MAITKLVELAEHLLEEPPMIVTKTMEKSLR